jgi:ferredoxin-NADP reductase
MEHDKMEQHPVKIISIQHVTHDVLQIVTERPPHYSFLPGQATDIAINKSGWQEKKSPFTFTCLPESDFLEFTIKTYPSHKGVTNELLHLKKNDSLLLHEVFGDIAYKNEGVFIAGGAGVTPFISIFRYLYAQNMIGGNKLIFANKTRADIILEQEFHQMLGGNFTNILAEEKTDQYAQGLISESFLKKYIRPSTKNIYLCGPPPMLDAVEKYLSALHIDENTIVREAV